MDDSRHDLSLAEFQDWFDKRRAVGGPADTIIGLALLLAALEEALLVALGQAGLLLRITYAIGGSLFPWVYLIAEIAVIGLGIVSLRSSPWQRWLRPVMRERLESFVSLRGWSRARILSAELWRAHALDLILLPILLVFFLQGIPTTKSLFGLFAVPFLIGMAAVSVFLLGAILMQVVEDTATRVGLVLGFLYVPLAIFYGIGFPEFAAEYALRGLSIQELLAWQWAIILLSALGIWGSVGRSLTLSEIVEIGGRDEISSYDFPNMVEFIFSPFQFRVSKTGDVRVIFAEGPYSGYVTVRQRDVNLNPEDVRYRLWNLSAYERAIRKSMDGDALVAPASDESPGILHPRTPTARSETAMSSDGMAVIPITVHFRPQSPETFPGFSDGLQVRADLMQAFNDNVLNTGRDLVSDLLAASSQTFRFECARRLNTLFERESRTEEPLCGSFNLSGFRSAVAGLRADAKDTMRGLNIGFGTIMSVSHLQEERIAEAGHTYQKGILELSQQLMERGRKLLSEWQLATNQLLDGNISALLATASDELFPAMIHPRHSMLAYTDLDWRRSLQFLQHVSGLAIRTSAPSLSDDAIEIGREIELLRDKLAEEFDRADSDMKARLGSFGAERERIISTMIGRMPSSRSVWEKASSTLFAREGRLPPIGERLGKLSAADRERDRTPADSPAYVEIGGPRVRMRGTRVHSRPLIAAPSGKSASRSSNDPVADTAGSEPDAKAAPAIKRSKNLRTNAAGDMRVSSPRLTSGAKTPGDKSPDQLSSKKFRFSE